MKKKSHNSKLIFEWKEKSQDAILQDEEKRKEINEKLELFKWDQAQNPFVTIFRSVKKSSVKNQVALSTRWGNMELIELKQTSATIPCSSCLMYVPEGLNMCQCCVWRRLNQSTIRIRIAFAALKTPYFRTTEISSRGKKSGHNPWQTHHVKAMDAR